MKKFLVLAALILLLLPVSAMAGMTSASDTDLEGVKGQTGITLSMSMSVTAGQVLWGDSDGFTATTAYTTQGWLILSSVTLPSIAVTDVSIDVGSSATTTYLGIATTGNIITGNLTVGAIVLGSTTTTTTPSLGELQVKSIGVSFGTIKISAH